MTPSAAAASRVRNIDVSSVFKRLALDSEVTIYLLLGNPGRIMEISASVAREFVDADDPPALGMALQQGERQVLHCQMQRIIWPDSQAMRDRGPNRAAVADDHHVLARVTGGQAFQSRTGTL